MKGQNPVKGKKKGRKILWIVLVVICAVVFLVSGGMLLHYGLEYHQIDSENQQVEQLLEQEPTQEQIEALPEGAQEQAAAPYAANQDFVGSITVPNTVIHYAVVQTTDNDKYLHTSFYGTYSRLGTVFADYRCQIAPEGMSDNTILYGHNANNGSFFHELTNYTSASYAQSHSTVQFDTIYENQTYVVIGAFLADPDATGEDLFDYQNYIDFSQRDFATFQEQITQRSYFHASVDWDETDRYLTLSTCDYDINNGRIVADGPPRDAVTPALLRQLYGVPARFLETDDGVLIAPVRRSMFRWTPDMIRFMVDAEDYNGAAETLAAALRQRIPGDEIGFPTFFPFPSDVALGQGRGHPFPVVSGPGTGDAAHLGKQHINEKQLCHPGRDRSQLQGRLIGAAL